MDLLANATQFEFHELSKKSQNASSACGVNSREHYAWILSSIAIICFLCFILMVLKDVKKTGKVFNLIIRDFGYFLGICGLLEFVLNPYIGLLAMTFVTYGYFDSFCETEQDATIRKVFGILSLIFLACAFINTLSLLCYGRQGLKTLLRVFNKKRHNTKSEEFQTLNSPSDKTTIVTVTVE